MEGLAGIDDWHLWDSRYPKAFAQGQKLLAAEVNAAVEGLFAGGASAVDTFDQHGSGRPDSEPDLPRELLDRRAGIVLMSEVITAQAAREHNYDVVVTVGGHSRARRGSFAAHTVSSGAEIYANGVALTEVSLIAYQWGQYGVPLIMATGVDTLREDLRDFSWIEFVAVKRSKSGSEVELMPLDQVYNEVREAARRAVQNLPSARVATLSEPITIAVRAVPPGDLDQLRGMPGMTHEGGGVTFTSPRLNPDGANAMVVISGLASQGGHFEILKEVVREHSDGEAILRHANDLYTTRYLDYESGYCKPDAATRD
jgi:D-amino peptidase